MEKIIHQIWIGPYKIPEKEKNFCKIIKDSHPDFKYMFWDNNNMPELPEKLLELKNNLVNYKNWIDISHILRYAVVKNYGGLYLDTDYELLSPIHDFNLEDHDGFMTLHFNNIDDPDKTICNSVFGFNKNHPLIEYICDSVTTYNGGWLGPEFFGNTIRNYFNVEQKEHDNVLYEKLCEVNIKAMAARNGVGEFSEKYLKHHLAYNWKDVPRSEIPLKVDENFNGLI